MAVDQLLGVDEDTKECLCVSNGDVLQVEFL